MPKSTSIKFPFETQITTASGMKRQLSALNKNQGPKITRWLFDTWNAQGKALRLEDISTALKNGTLSPHTLSSWRNAYIQNISELSDAWKVSNATRGQFVVDGMFNSAALRTPIQYDLASNAMNLYFQN